MYCNELIVNLFVNPLFFVHRQMVQTYWQIATQSWQT